MDELARRFEEHRGRLRAMALRLLGSADEADDAVQEAWLRLARADAAAVANLGGWLTTVVGRICLDLLRARRHRGTEELDEDAAGDADPERDALLAESVGAALGIVLDTLAPAERLVFVLHDIFAVPFEEIAPIIGRTPAATKMLASRARRRVRNGDGAAASSTHGRAHHEVVAAFLEAARRGDFDALLALLAPGAELRPDHVARGVGFFATETGAHRVARAFTGRARGADEALVDGAAAWAWAPGGHVRGLFLFTVVDGLVTAIDIVGDPGEIGRREVRLA
ncbi:sigma-70 family RNA polymerase sigma factor [Dactylosporangium sp. NPDC049140]|uniref:sigma-70 family RNA polymerase sigma factor n=1 Tax=Dactylosporangium sp. NPDC049140 TaxID=3155647 RepID=UPI0033D28331